MFKLDEICVWSTLKLYEFIDKVVFCEIIKMPVLRTGIKCFWSMANSGVAFFPDVHFLAGHQGPARQFCLFV